MNVNGYEITESAIPVLTKDENSDTQSVNTGKKRTLRLKKPQGTQEKIEERNVRTNRVPLKDQRAIGSVRAKPGYKIRLVNDTDDRIEKFKLAGYEHVESKDVKSDQRSKDPSQPGSVACQEVGGGIKGYFMQIPEELYNEDQAAKLREVDEKMRRIELSAIPESQRSRYHGGIQITTELKKD